MSAQTVSLITPERYLEMDRASDLRHEYFQGRMWAMSGGSIPHAYIISNVVIELGQRLKGGPCNVASSDLRLRVSEDGLYTYPDVVVVCGEVRTADNRIDTILNPTVLIEVLSKSTEAYDRGWKAAQYRRIETLQEYMLVSQREPRVEIYRRHGAGEWLFTEVFGLSGSCELSSIGCRVPMADLYHNISFDLLEPEA